MIAHQDELDGNCCTHDEGISSLTTEDENKLTADDLVAAVIAATTAASKTKSTTHLVVSVRAEEATNRALKECTEIAHATAIRVHSTAWKLYRASAAAFLRDQTPNRDAYVDAFDKHERAIQIHHVLRNRFIRSR